MEFLDPFGTGNGSAVPSPAKKPSGMNYGGAQARMRAQSGNVGSTNQAGGQLGAYGSGNGTGAKRNNTKPSTVGLGALSMLDPLAQQQGGLPVRPQSESERRRNKPIGRPPSTGMMPAFTRGQASGSSPVLDEFDPLSGGGNNGSTGSFGAVNQDSFDSGDFDAFTSQPANTASFTPSTQRPTMNVTQAFGGVGAGNMQAMSMQPQQQQRQQAMMAGLGQQVFNMGISNQTQGQSTANAFGAGDSAGFFDDDAFGTAANDDFGESDFGDNGFGAGDSGGFDLDTAAAEIDKKEEKKRKKAEKKRRKEEAARAAQEKADREFAMKLHAEENSMANADTSSAAPEASASRLPRGWTQDHRGNIQGRLFERVTTKMIGHKWSPRSVLITQNSITLRKVEADKRGQQRAIQITEYTTVGSAYINPEQAHAMIDVDGTGLKRVYQFKLIEKEPWGQEPKQLAKLGSTDLKVIRFLRKEIADRVAAKF